MVLDVGDLVIWDAPRRAAQSEALAAKKLRRWIKEFRPEVIVTENPDCAGQKSGAQIEILKALASVAEDHPVLNIIACRKKRFKNAYLEAEDLGQQFPDIQHLVPKKPQIWKPEPYFLACFEALALVREAGLLKSDASSDPEEEDRS